MINEIRNITSSPNQSVVLLTEKGSSTRVSSRFSAFSGSEFKYYSIDDSWVRNNGTKLFFRDIEKPVNMSESGIRIVILGFDRELTETERLCLSSWKKLNP